MEIDLIACEYCGSFVRRDLYDHHLKRNCKRIRKLKKGREASGTKIFKANGLFANCRYCGRSTRKDELKAHCLEKHNAEYMNDLTVERRTQKEREELEKILARERRKDEGKDALNFAFYGGAFDGNRRKH